MTNISTLLALFTLLIWLHKTYDGPPRPSLCYMVARRHRRANVKPLVPAS